MTARHAVGFAIVGLLALMVAGGLWLQREATIVAAGERDALSNQMRELARARAEHQRLQAIQVSDAELAALRADHAAVARLRDEIDALKKQADKAAAAPAPAKAPTAVVPVNEWQNRGRATPHAAVETVLWAAAGGDVDALAAAVMFEPRNRPMIDAFFGALPPELQSQYRTPERLVAFFTAKDITRGTVRIVGDRENKPDDVSIGVMLQAPGGEAKSALLNLRKADDGWRLVVPVTAVQNYANRIGALLAAGAKP